MALKYNVSRPVNDKTQYTEYDSVDFFLTGQNQKLICNNIYLLFDAQITGATTNDYITMNNLVGSHGFIGSISFSTQMNGEVEFIEDYARYVSVSNQCSIHPDLTTFGSNLVCQNIAPSVDIERSLLQGIIDRDKAQGEAFPTQTNPPTYNQYLDAALKPHFGLNKMVGDVELPFNKTGYIKITIRLPKNSFSMYGSDKVGTDVLYNLKNLRVMYNTIPDDNKHSAQYPFKTVSSVRQSLTSNFSTISTLAPIVGTSFFVVFLPTVDENNNMKDSVALHKVPLLDEVQFLFNDSFNNTICYTLDNEQEIISNFVESVKQSYVEGVSNLNLQAMSRNEVFGLGMLLSSSVDFSKSKLTVNMKSGISNALPYNAYVFFQGFSSL
jgi:hypothetical protein